ncbi:MULTISPECIES: MaoC family dehydratase N-terminal domain-containing protein [unclassified Caballeronia]|uniref:FAS1-like dehydratase domain-containing protein n=1 Tax=unclassified Caballeronia TaxID=2646786 RepID=UPI0020295D9D|nr:MULTISPECIES: MaoC family dehydratase N-terminal domain-containing protein [unclassified Caballeronia]MDR5765869.1 MaoC family dehydratase N-terminal domain-containing protein [Caballeronia sp. LZ028]
MDVDTLYVGWTSRTEILHEHVDARRVEALAATLDVSMDVAEGNPLPPGWQWLFFNPVARRSELGMDGHPRRDTPGSFLPPVPLPRRMWAGSRIQYLRGVPIGSEMTRTSRIAKHVEKEGRAGKLCFVTVEHRISVDGEGCIFEEQDIVYREASSASPMTQPAPDAPSEFRQTFTADSTVLFRYSALTFNGHRIHYDKSYACEVEGYRNLVVHGPLTATLLQNFASSCRPGHRLSGFEFKGVSPLLVDEGFELQAWADADDSSLLRMRVIDARGALGMLASAQFRNR